MQKKYFWQTEYSIILLVIFAVILLFMPMSIQNTAQAMFISKWNEQYNRIDYMFTVIDTHISDEIIKNFDETKTSQEKEQLLLMLVKPYLRIDTEHRPPKHYKPRYMNNTKVFKGEPYYFDEYYFTKNNIIAGIKDVKSTNAEEPFFMMMFDLNGLMPPNRWGKDIFGVNIYDKGKIEPFGAGIEMDELKKDCSKEGSGITCSYYYKIGGGFDG